MRIDDQIQHAREQIAEGGQIQHAEAGFADAEHAERTTGEESAEQPGEQHELPRIAHPALAHEVAEVDAEVGDDATDVRGPQRQAAVAARHRVLHAAGGRGQRHRDQVAVLREKGRDHQQRSLDQQRMSVAAAGAQVAVADDDAGQEGADQEAADDAEEGLQVIGVAVDEVDADLRDAAAHVRDRQVEEAQHDRVDEARRAGEQHAAGDDPVRGERLGVGVGVIGAHRQGWRWRGSGVTRTVAEVRECRDGGGGDQAGCGRGGGDRAVRARTGRQPFPAKLGASQRSQAGSGIRGEVRRDKGRVRGTLRLAGWVDEENPAIDSRNDSALVSLMVNLLGCLPFCFVKSRVSYFNSADAC